MKLLFAIKKLANVAGGAERVLAHVTGGLARRGHDVTVLTWDKIGATPFYPLGAEVKLISRGVGDAGRPTRLVELAARMFDLRHVILAMRPHVVVGFCHSMFVPLSLALVGSGIPVIASEHAARNRYRRRPLEYAATNVAAALSSGMTVTSAAIGKEFAKTIRRRMVVMPNPIMIDAPASGRRTGRLLLNIGRFSPQKDHETLIRAFARVAPRFAGWRLRILGEGHLRSEIEALVAQSGLSDRVELPGVTRDVLSHYAEADVFVLSSIWESFGLVTIEAMAQRLPVIGFSDCPGTNELVLDGETGLLVKPQDDRVAALADGMAQLMGNSALRLQMGERGYARANQLAAADEAIDRWESLVMRVARSTGPAS